MATFVFFFSLALRLITNYHVIEFEHDNKRVQTHNTQKKTKMKYIYIYGVSQAPACTGRYSNSVAQWILNHRKIRRKKNDEKNNNK